MNQRGFINYFLDLHLIRVKTAQKNFIVLSAFFRLHIIELQKTTNYFTMKIGSLPPFPASLCIFLSKLAEGKGQDSLSVNTAWLAAMQRPQL